MTCAIIIIVKGRGKEWPRRCPRKKINQKKVRKPLDNPQKVRYNKGTKGEGRYGKAQDATRLRVRPMRVCKSY